MSPNATDRIRVVLGSASSGRLRVLRSAGIDPTVIVSDVDEDALIESLGSDAAPDQVVTTLAQAKATAVAQRILDGAVEQIPADTDAVVIGCDSMLLIDGRLVGKPHTPERARTHWRSVRGRSGELMTGHCVHRLSGGAVIGVASAAAVTTVHFSDADDAVIDAYVATGEPLEVAGGFTIDGLGGWLIDGVDGDPSAVVGIGLPLVRRLFADLDVSVADLWRTARATPGAATAHQ
ncbi:nucleoside triphosphate pyrophosphatase [Williamsia sp. CHRR-6]|uniref:Maf family protein n=1 Tax=Williamsia sp. CHRR-6 TaxID=2835871 RepID=UPI001BDB2FB8|nr:nucleoside triphosphate pyrophosphatase [Williamsia sp. CHRR-6]MBT0566875.1 septum formation inhibitor Maf [Williamsia sp. CHRR-6]